MSMKRFLHSFKKISPAGLTAARMILVLCCVMAGAGVVICLMAGEPCLANFRAYRMAQALAETQAGILLVAGIALVIVECR